jgi:hypothetical protein
MRTHKHAHFFFTALLLACLAMLVFSTACLAGVQATMRVHRIPEYGIEVQAWSNSRVETHAIWLPGDPNGDGAPAHEFGFLPEYSSRFISGVSYRTRLRIFLLTRSANTDEARRKMHGWSEKPSLRLFPFEQTHKDDLVKAIERLYLQRPTSWDRVDEIQIAGHNALEMSGWERRLGKDSEFFQEIRAIPLPEEQVLVIHSGYFRLSGKKVDAQRKTVSEIVKSLRFTKPAIP